MTLDEAIAKLQRGEKGTPRRTDWTPGVRLLRGPTSQLLKFDGRSLQPWTPDAEDEAADWEWEA